MSDPDPTKKKPSYYPEPQPVDVIRAWDLPFCVGSAVAYLARAGRKPGEPAVKDYRKAIHFLEIEIAALEKKADAERIAKYVELIAKYDGDDGGPGHVSDSPVACDAQPIPRPHNGQRVGDGTADDPFRFRCLDCGTSFALTHGAAGVGIRACDPPAPPVTDSPLAFVDPDNDPSRAHFTEDGALDNRKRAERDALITAARQAGAGSGNHPAWDICTCGHPRADHGSAPSTADAARGKCVGPDCTCPYFLRRDK
jgi:hypothetical protein